MEEIQSFYKKYKKDSSHKILEIKFGIYEDRDLISGTLLKTAWTEEAFWKTMKKVEKALIKTYYSIHSLSRTVYEKGSILIRYDNTREDVHSEAYSNKNMKKMNSKPQCFQYENFICRDNIYGKSDDKNRKKGFRIILKHKKPLYYQLIPSSSDYDNIYNEFILSYRVNQEYYINFIKRISRELDISSYHIQIIFIKSDKLKIHSTLADIITLISSSYQ